MTAHLLIQFAWLCTTAGLLLFIRQKGRRKALQPLTKKITRWFFIVLLINEVGWYLTQRLYLKIPLTDNLPLHLCDFAVLSALATLAYPKSIFRHFTYYVGLPAGSLALLFPNVTETGTIAQLATHRFFLTHTILVATAVLVLKTETRPWPVRSALQIWCIVFILCGSIASLVNATWGQNYMYLAHPPAHPAWVQSLPHTAYLLLYSFLFLLVFFVLHRIQNRAAS